MYEHAESLIDEWPDWGVALPGRPTVLEQVAHSETNEIYQIHTGERNLALRIFNPSTNHDLDRLQEIRIHRHAAQIGVAPALLYCDPQLRYALIDWIPAEPPITSDSAQIDKVINCVQRYQSSDISALALQPYPYVEKLESYISTALQSQSQRISSLAAFEKEGARAIKTLEHYEANFGHRRCLTHNDLNAHNVLWHHQTHPSPCVIIDWEFAGLGIASLDLAGLITEFDLEPDSSQLSQYCKNMAIGQDELEQALQCYSLLCSYYRFSMLQNE